MPIRISISDRPSTTMRSKEQFPRNHKKKIFIIIIINIIFLRKTFPRFINFTTFLFIQYKKTFRFSHKEIFIIIIIIYTFFMEDISKVYKDHNFSSSIKWPSDSRRRWVVPRIRLSILSLEYIYFFLGIHIFLYTFYVYIFFFVVGIRWMNFQEVLIICEGPRGLQ